jgi:hypothetical protein
MAAGQTCTVSGSSVTVTGGSCAIVPNTTLNGTPAVHATTSAQITTNNVTINPFNGGSIGGFAETSGTIVFSSGSTITGNWSTAALAQTAGQIIFQSGSTINPSFGGGGTALLANGAGSQIIATGLAVNLSGAGNNIGAEALAGGKVALSSGTTINFLQGGGQNTGLLASRAGSQIVSNGATVTIPNLGGAGANDTGVRADGGASVMLNGGAVTVNGNGGGETGLLATGAGSSITGSGVTVNVSSNDGSARGGFLQNGANIALSGGSVTTIGGAGSYGFLFQAPAGVTNALGLDGTVVSSASDAFAVQGGIATINATDAMATGNNGIVLSAADSSNVAMTSNRSTLTGAMLTDASSTSNVPLGNGTTWNMTGSSNVTNLTNNDSDIISTPAASAFKTLTVMNYMRTGGTITLNTILGADNSPSDRLIVSGGTATGATNLKIQNAKGPGDETVAHGILVVSTTNGGTTAPGAFSLVGEVRGGAYDYFLLPGRPQWRCTQQLVFALDLRCAAVVLQRRVADFDIRTPAPPSTSTSELQAPPPILPPDSPPSTLPPGKYPIIGPELATYGVVQPVARELGLGALNQRVGDTMTLANASTDASG